MKGNCLKFLLIEAYIEGARSYSLQKLVGKEYNLLREQAHVWADKRLKDFVTNCMEDLDL